MEKILLDTDIGGDIDDAICLAYLLRELECELIGITTVCGEPEKRAAVADGAEALRFWQHNTYEKADAPAFLYQNIKENPHEITLIEIGNMTNCLLLSAGQNLQTL